MVCKPRDKGGLEVKDVGVLNLALLRKWKWRILNETNTFWLKLLSSRYGNVKVKVQVGDSSMSTSKDSICWRDLILSSNIEEVDQNCFNRGFLCKVKDGISVALWKSCWLGNQALRMVFLEIYQ
ncbi:uncharacterized mitochondrial protein AtMg00310-like [Vicia villosa]|uniref:uncharacterized mitochondrial protein AtMg00310-like n=1 Tax=Vicia villosa TaxID=3911 RepID=UPI00273C7393|nr:uncharacterized mitochondrial protein AtMg00310-like [Vicia villosa]